MRGGRPSQRWKRGTLVQGVCEFDHAPDKCKCHLPVYWIGQDESVFKAYQLNAKEWVIGGTSKMRKKTDGPGLMVSAMQDEERGLGFPITQAELHKVNEKRQERNLPPLDGSPGLLYFDYGKSKEGYWDNDKFEKQVQDLMFVLDVLHRGRQLVLEIDWSAGHAKMADDALSTNNTNAGFGGKQRKMRDTVVT
ncbi:unnamed protein product, partial [Chrysoparadoxa australica]